MWFDRILAIAKNPLLETLSLFNTEYFVEATGIPASIHTLSLDVAWVPTFTPDVTNNLDIAR
ncbi:hypothetical protein EST38_g9720 [Candolleomyces aberdarensis]|uniref:Uncharacterized protein n=1 Tax=Candolleomyces aberdarensis TaxID=2316362 RepID=A0A4Q2D977_9AGAR|nr:hypothetical protein EST38_g9720 [Candolleomyces aberdarensis]